MGFALYLVRVNKKIAIAPNLYEVPQVKRK
jgi:hypothetical protein